MAEQQIMNEFLANRQTKDFVALDEVQNGTVWQSAGPRITKRLNKNLYEYEVRRLFKNAIVRMTYNERHGAHQLSQGQVVVLVDLPEDEADVASLRLRLRLAPPGIRNIDVNNVTAEWPTVTVGTRTTPPLIVGACLQMGRRSQFPVRCYFCSTIHRIQGDTVPLLATQLSNSERQYRLWQRNNL